MNNSTKYIPVSQYRTTYIPPLSIVSKTRDHCKNHPKYRNLQKASPPLCSGTIQQVFLSKRSAPCLGLEPGKIFWVISKHGNEIYFNYQFFLIIFIIYCQKVKKQTNKFGAVFQNRSALQCSIQYARHQPNAPVFGLVLQQRFLSD